ncbi:hypothetical protein [Sphingobium sp. BS19]|uniref:hypothetical protein n=1 Tax=Sphingobium sp. BS19 TaxID=3018973 RepID=UPI0022EEC59F|nr:hypothetical protein [Sphingobium sp. BS19]GLI98989.1 hypothetical protein Sbs19_28070 [Sphingobium sp. BS19]
MERWTFLLGGMIVWTVHFFALYAVASIFLTTPLARWLTLVVSVCCLGADAWLFRRALTAPHNDGVDRWSRTTALLLIGGSTIAVLWQALPAVLI